MHIFTLDGEKDVQLRIRGEGLHPVSAEIIRGGGKAEKLDMAVAASSGNAVIDLHEIRPCFAMVRIQYEKREEQ